MKLEDLRDEDLFYIDNKLASEIEKRIIKLLKTNNITQYTIENSTYEVEVYGIYSNKPSGDVKIQSIGYVVDKFTSEEPSEYVYILDNNANFYSSDEIADILFIFKLLKDKLCAAE